jgi:hypothetical protein
MKQLLKVCVVIIGIASLFINNISKDGNDGWGDLACDNIEALASGEGGGFGCFSNGSIDCGGYKVKYKITGYSIDL